MTFRLGAHVDGRGTTFAVLATTAKEVGVRFFSSPGVPRRDERLVEMEPHVFVALVEGEAEETLYQILLDGEEVVDPYARWLPHGVHGPAMVMAARTCDALATPPSFDGWTLYELHVGTFTREGTWSAAVEKLDYLRDLGVDAIEILPVAAFDGARGWGYDGVALFAPHAAYGTPDDMRRFVREAHARGLAVVLDVVYNHFGPSGNRLPRFSERYFTKDQPTPWGPAPDFAHPPMRELALANVRYWFEEFGLDGLRLDATHAIHDPSDEHLLRAVTDVAHALGRRVFFEDERNDPAVVTELGADAVWADDFHHQVHVLLTGERDGYYAAYEPTVDALARTIRDGFGYTGQPYAPWQGRPRGKSSDMLRPAQFVYCIQNHDQVGNRAFGTRLSAECDAGAYKAASMLLLFLPHTVLLFMGQEWAASSPFLFFSDHEGALGEAVSKGRREEFRAFSSFAGDIPDPQALQTFERSKLAWDDVEGSARVTSVGAIEPGSHAEVLSLYRTLLHLRRTDPVLSGPARSSDVEVRVHGDLLEVVRRRGKNARHLFVNFGMAAASIPLEGVVLASTAVSTAGLLAPRSAVVIA